VANEIAKSEKKDGRHQWHRNNDVASKPPSVKKNISGKKRKKKKKKKRKKAKIVSENMKIRRK